MVKFVIFRVMRCRFRRMIRHWLVVIRGLILMLTRRVDNRLPVHQTMPIPEITSMRPGEQTIDRALARGEVLRGGPDRDEHLLIPHIQPEINGASVVLADHGHDCAIWELKLSHADRASLVGRKR
jgi:hypothetical protein